MSLGFATLNEVVPAFKFLGGCDINFFSASTYSHNFGTPLINMDIIELSKNKTKLQEWLDNIGYDKKKKTVLIGCAPCQGFTSHRKKYWYENDDRRNNLMRVFANIVEYIHPDAFLMENVPEFFVRKILEIFRISKRNFYKLWL